MIQCKPKVQTLIGHLQSSESVENLFGLRVELLRIVCELPRSLITAIRFLALALCSSMLHHCAIGQPFSERITGPWGTCALGKAGCIPAPPLQALRARSHTAALPRPRALSPGPRPALAHCTANAPHCVTNTPHCGLSASRRRHHANWPEGRGAAPERCQCTTQPGRCK